jgi:ubiquinone/menaquinone biosynthesis C-methylase UbiE
MGNGNQKNGDVRVEVSYLGMASSIHRVTEPAIRSAIRALQLLPGSRGLDAGCGVGKHTLWLAEAVSPGGHVIGVDISRSSLDRAEEAVRGSGQLEAVSFQYGDMRSLPFDDDAFDWVWNADALWVGPKEMGLPVEDPVPIVREFARVVRPGATVAILYWSSQRLLPGYPLLEARLNATRAANFPYTDRMRPESHILRTLGWLREAGLEEPTVCTCVADVQAPLDEAARRGLPACFQMFWRNAEPEVTPEDWAAFQRLCRPKSPDFILDLPDYYAFITYSLFHARVPA